MLIFELIIAYIKPCFAVSRDHLSLVFYPIGLIPNSNGLNSFLGVALSKSGVKFTSLFLKYE